MESPRRSLLRSLVLASLTLTFPSLVPAALISGPNPNLLVNGDFADGTKGWDFRAHLKQGQVVADSVETHAGHPSVRIENLGADDSHLSQKVAVKPATRYQLTGWVKTKGVVPQDPKSLAGASLAVRDGFLKSPALNKTQGWKRLSVEIVTVAETEITIGPRLGAFGGIVKGTAWFAELELREIGPVKR